MYELNSDEIQKFRNDAYFNRAMQSGYKMGLSKEESLSRFVMVLLSLKDEAFQEKVGKLMIAPAVNLFNPNK